MVVYWHHDHTHHHGNGHHHTHDHHTHDDHIQTFVQKQFSSKMPEDVSLGRIPSILEQLCLSQGTHHPKTTPRSMILFAADDGMQRADSKSGHEEMSALAQGHALIPALAKNLNVDLRIVNLVSGDGEGVLPPVEQIKVRADSQVHQSDSGMRIRDVTTAMRIGADVAAEEIKKGSRLLIISDLGSNQRNSLYMLAAVGMGISFESVLEPDACRKIADALHRHKDALLTPVSMLAAFGSMDLAAMVGAMIQAGSHQCTILLDDMASFVASFFAQSVDSSTKHAFLATHVPSTPGASLLLEKCPVQPVLNLHLQCSRGIGALHFLPLADSVADVSR
jgi:nicotinate-nucleotide--dimethylbenzimidazole phosphoribosyltransferase